MIFHFDDPDKTGARELVAAENGIVRARATLHEARDLVDAPGTSGLVGDYDAADNESGRLLLEEACLHFRRRGVERVLGPMNGSTWQTYRLVLPPAEQPPPPGGIAWPQFRGEPHNPPDAAVAWRAAGFAIAARYESAVVLDLRASAGALPEPPAGVHLRPLALERYDDELEVLFAASRRGFARNPYYAPITRADFRGTYSLLRLILVDPSWLEIAEDEAGRVLGFLLCYPSTDLAFGRPVLVAKTIAVVPEARGRGIGRLLFARAHGRAHARGFGSVIHALMHVGNVSTRLSAGERAQPFRRYALFERTP